MVDFSLAKKDDEPDLSSEGQIAEMKMDGTRIAYISGDSSDKPLLRNRRGNNKTGNFREITDVEIPDNTVLDGEVIVRTEENPHGDFNKLLKRSNTKKDFKQKVLSKKLPAEFVVFDVLKYKGEDVTDRKYPDRRELVEDIVGDVDSDRLSVCKKWDNPEEGWSYALENDLEGIIVKKIDSVYESGRTSVWKKVKTFEVEEMTAVEFERHNRGVKVTTENEVELTVNGSIAEPVAETIDEEGEIDIEVGFLEKTKNGSYRHPTFRGRV